MLDFAYLMEPLLRMVLEGLRETEPDCAEVGNATNMVLGFDLGTMPSRALGAPIAN